jgi:DNA replication licensing factor MCM6
MIDEPDEVLDYNIAQHIVSVHQRQDQALAPEFSTAQLQRYIAVGRGKKPEVLCSSRRVLKCGMHDEHISSAACWGTIKLV